MIRDNPEGAALLSEARHMLNDVVLPALPGEVRYQALLVIRAISLVERQFQADTKAEARLTCLLASYQEAGAFKTNAEFPLSLQIRKGHWDAAPQVFGLLQELAAHKRRETGT